MADRQRCDSGGDQRAQPPLALPVDRRSSTALRGEINPVSSANATVIPATAPVSEPLDANPALPNGTVTFLMTDIEGSTRLWEQHPGAMESALARHDALADGVIRRNGGTLLKKRGEGDSLFAVFSRARNAVAAALALQSALQTEPWPAPIRLRVRMAIHTGACELRDGDYYGTAVNRCARLRAAARGGQILLSGATQELVLEELPPGSFLHDLGVRRLRDVQRPARVFQLMHPDLTSAAPSMRYPMGGGRGVPRAALFVALVLVLLAIGAECLTLFSK